LKICEVADHVVGGLAAGLQRQLSNGKGAGDEQQRVAIGRRVLHVGRGNGAARAGTVFHDHRLAQAGRHSFGEEPGDDVGVPACWITVDDGNRARWPLADFGSRGSRRTTAHGGRRNTDGDNDGDPGGGEPEHAKSCRVDRYPPDRLAGPVQRASHAAHGSSDSFIPR
jgi:hypothetical protein